MKRAQTSLCLLLALVTTAGCKTASKRSSLDSAQNVTDFTVFPSGKYAVSCNNGDKEVYQNQLDYVTAFQANTICHDKDNRNVLPLVGYKKVISWEVADGEYLVDCADPVSDVVFKSKELFLAASREDKVCVGVTPPPPPPLRVGFAVNAIPVDGVYRLASGDVWASRRFLSFKKDGANITAVDLKRSGGDIHYICYEDGKCRNRDWTDLTLSRAGGIVDFVKIPDDTSMEECKPAKTRYGANMGQEVPVTPAFKITLAAQRYKFPIYNKLATLVVEELGKNNMTVSIFDGNAVIAVGFDRIVMAGSDLTGVYSVNHGGVIYTARLMNPDQRSLGGIVSGMGMHIIWNINGQDKYYFKYQPIQSGATCTIR